MPYSYPAAPYGQHDWRQSYPYTHPMYLAPSPYTQQFPPLHPVQSYMNYQMPQKRSENSKDDPHSETIDAVIQKITHELKAILKKDFNKKMVENTAFKKFESWWEEESSKENKSKNKEEFAEKSAQTKDNINVLLEANRENLYSNINLDSFGFGLGLKASLPKMPSFRRKKIPSPVQEDEDSRKLSDNDEIVHDSDTELSSRTIRRVQKRSSSPSSSSDSASSSSESESSSSDESSSDSESETEQISAKMEQFEKPRPEAKLEVTKESQPEATKELQRKPVPEPVPERQRKEKTPEKIPIEKMEVEHKKVETPKPPVSNRYSKIYVSDSDVSDGELEYIERRRKNTEWMEQIEKERKTREVEEIRPRSVTPILDEDVDMMDELIHDDSLESKSLEKLESEREELLRQVRNPEPPEEYSTEGKEDTVKSQTSSDDENLEARRKKKEEIIQDEFNGMLDHKAKRISESSVDGDLGSPTSQVTLEHSYCMQPVELTAEASQQNLDHDHGYTSTQQKAIEKPPVEEKVPKPRKRKEHKKLQELQNTINYNDPYDKFNSRAPYTIHSVKHKERDVMSQMSILYEFLTKGIDHEDILYMKQSYELMLADDSMGYWLNDTHWVDHCVTDLYSCPPKRRKRDDVKVHSTGSARTEGYYKIEAQEKAKYKYHHSKSNAVVAPNGQVSKMQGNYVFKNNHTLFTFSDPNMISLLLNN